MSVPVPIPNRVVMAKKHAFIVADFFFNSFALHLSPLHRWKMNLVKKRNPNFFLRLFITVDLFILMLLLEFKEDHMIKSRKRRKVYDVYRKSLYGLYKMGQMRRMLSRSGRSGGQSKVHMREMPLSPPRK